MAYEEKETQTTESMLIEAHDRVGVVFIEIAAMADRLCGPELTAATGSPISPISPSSGALGDMKERAISIMDRAADADRNISRIMKHFN